MGFVAAEIHCLEARCCGGAGSSSAGRSYLAAEARWTLVFELRDCTPPLLRFAGSLLGVFHCKSLLRARKNGIAPLSLTISERRTGTIRKNIIGHGMPILGAHVDG